MKKNKKVQVASVSTQNQNTEALEIQTPEAPEVQTTEPVELSPDMKLLLEEKVIESKGKIVSKTIENSRSLLRTGTFNFNDIRYFFNLIEQKMVHNKENMKERFHHISDLLLSNKSVVGDTEKNFLTTRLIPQSEMTDKMKSHFGFTDDELTSFLKGEIEVTESKKGIRGKYQTHLTDNNGLFIKLSYFAGEGDKKVKSHIWRTIGFLSR